MPPASELERRSHAVLMRALEVEPAGRPDFVDGACADDAALARRVRELLAAAERMTSFLERPALSTADDELQPIPDAVGDYLVVGVLGVGGMAVVYEALQDQPRRRVALKVMRRGLTRREAYLRFRFETEVLARLRHPGIAQIFEAGTAHLGSGGAAPFFAMEFIPDALPITAYADRHAMPLLARLEMFAAVCDAVHHGHQLGVIHRDLKPGNILVGADGRPKVIDFGVARSVEGGAEPITVADDERQVIGTLHYMSPEQCGAGTAIDLRTDVYALGVCLYELACGRLPHDFSAVPLPAALHAITRDPPLRPREACPSVPADVEAIILRAIDKDPRRRYASAEALAADVRRYLDHQPVEATSPGPLHRFRLFARRNRALVSASVAVAASIVLVAAVSSALAVRLAAEAARREAAEHRAIRERDAAVWQAYIAQVAGALSAMQTGEFQQMRTRLHSAAPQHRGWEWDFLATLSEQSLGTVEAHADMILGLAVAPDGARFATAARDGSLRLWDADGGDLLAHAALESGDAIFALDFTPDGRHLATGDASGAVRLWDAEDLRPAGLVGTAAESVADVACLSGGRIAAATAGGTLQIWSRDGAAPPVRVVDQPGGVHGVGVSHDRSFIVTHNRAGAVWLRDADLALLAAFDFGGVVDHTVISLDDELLAAAGARGRVTVWSIPETRLVHDLAATGGVSSVRSLAFSNDATLIAAGVIQRGIVLISVADGAVAARLGGHEEAVSGLHFRPGDGVLVSSSWDGTLRSWSVADALSGGITALPGHDGYVFGVAFSPDGSLLASGTRSGSLWVWDPELAEPIARLPAHAGVLYDVTFAPDGRSLATAGADGAVRIWDAQTGRLTGEFAGAGSHFWSVAFDPTGERLAGSGSDRTARVWDARAGGEQFVLRGHEARVNCVRFGPDGETIATGSRDGTVRLWDARTGQERFRLDGHRSDVFAVLFSPDGRRLYSGSRDQTVRLWDVQSGACLETLDGHGQFVTCLALSPDGSRLAAGSWFGQVLLWDTATHDLIGSFGAQDSAIRGLSFSPDGRWLAVGSYNGTVRLLDTAPQARRLAARASAAEAQRTAAALVERSLDAAGGDLDAAMRSLESRPDLAPAERAWLRKAMLARSAAAAAP